MKKYIWHCRLCSKAYGSQGWLVRHLCNIHRKQRYPKDVTLKTAFDIADEGKIELHGQEQTQ